MQHKYTVMYEDQNDPGYRQTAHIWAENDQDVWNRVREMGTQWKDINVYKTKSGSDKKKT